MSRPELLRGSSCPSLSPVPRFAARLAALAAPVRGRAGRRTRREPADAVAAEVCEPRVLLSAVTAGVGGGDLSIRGDEGNDAFTVTNLGGGRYRIEGAAGTTVNGRAAVVVAGVRDDITIDTGGGNDSVTVRNADITGDLRISAGRGNDVVAVINARVGDDFDAQLGSGDNILQIAGLTVRDDFHAKGGDGRDRFELAVISVADEMGVDVEDGVNSVVVDRLFADDLRIEGGDGQDDMRLTNARVADDLRIKLDDGNDTLALASVAVGDELELDGGDGFDRVTLSRVFSRDRDLDDFERRSFA